MSNQDEQPKPKNAQKGNRTYKDSHKAFPVINTEIVEWEGKRYMRGIAHHCECHGILNAYFPILLDGGIVSSYI